MNLRILIATVLFFIGSNCADASMHVLDFENDNTDPAWSYLGNPTAYMQSALGRSNVSSNAMWFGNTSGLFGSDALVTFLYRATLDFDTELYSESDYKLTAISFDWGVLEETYNVDWGLDVYDDATTSWYNNYYTVTGANDGDTGSSGVLTFDASWEITRIRFHDHGLFDVAMDNLQIWDNSVSSPFINPAPEPTTLAIWLFGLGSVATFARRRRKIR